MSIGDALLEDICANPTDDDLRLIYADWLDDNGDPERARFIREQVRGVASWSTWYQKETEWTKAMPALPGIRWGGFRRGFIENIFVESVAAFEEAAPLIRRTIPLRGVFLEGGPPEAVARPCFAGLDYLTVYGKAFTDGNIIRFASAATLRSLTSLDLNLSTSTMTSAGLRTLFWSGNLRGLRSLSLNSPDGRVFGGEAAQVLADEYVLLGLTGDLCLHGWDLAGLAAANLAAARDLSSLRLVGDNLGDAGMAALCSAGMPSGLRSLLLTGNQIGPAGAAELANCRFLKEVSWLVLHDNPLMPEGVIALAERGVCRPRDLRMTNTRAGDAGLAALAQSPLLSKVKELEFGSNRLTPSGVVALANSPQVGCLRRLDLRGNGLKEADKALLASSPRLAGLKKLDIWG
jgi:uncharacterized protein (TIGR02996 family)